MANPFEQNINPDTVNPEQAVEIINQLREEHGQALDDVINSAREAHAGGPRERDFNAVADALKMDPEEVRKLLAVRRENNKEAA
ncbi:MAG: hypothetical protein K0S38_34 [Candidatus Paceibacter sp.]|jgi:hypothetical protein|nr:hypothetical protein [Candidatus Paceibacter sp.]